jgi:hypothetical protein
MSITREDLAFHESGHAVMAHAAGIAIREITIVHTATYLGRVALYGKDPTKRNPGIDPGTRKSVLEPIISFSLAGYIAEGFHRGRNPRWGGGGGCRSDFRDAADQAWRVCFGDRPMTLLGEPRVPSADSYLKMNSYLKHCFETTKVALRSGRRWAQVEAVAAALLERRTLSGREAKAIMLKAIEKYESGKQRG